MTLTIRFLTKYILRSRKQKSPICLFEVDNLDSVLSVFYFYERKSYYYFLRSTHLKINIPIIIAPINSSTDNISPPLSIAAPATNNTANPPTDNNA